MEPDDADIDPINAQPPKVERRMRKKSVDPVTAAALKKIHDKLRDKKELFKLHLKHYHMKLDAFKKRTSQLQLPKDIYDLYEQVVKECEKCSKLTDAPPRSKVSGMRAEVFGDLVFIDYGAVKNAAASARTRSSRSASSRVPNDEIREPSYDFMIILDGATNFIYAVR